MRDNHVWTFRAIISPDPDYRPISCSNPVMADRQSCGTRSCSLDHVWWRPLVGPKLPSHQHQNRSGRRKPGNLGSPVWGARARVETCPPTRALQVLVPQIDPQLTIRSCRGQTYIAKEKTKTVIKIENQSLKKVQNKSDICL